MIAPFLHTIMGILVWGGAYLPPHPLYILSVFVQSYCFKDGFQRVCSEILFKDLFQRVCLAIFKDLFKHKNQRFCSHIFSAFFQSYVFSDVFHDFPMIFQRFVTSFFNGLDRPQPRHEHMSTFTNKTELLDSTLSSFQHSKAGMKIAIKSFVQS